MWVVFISLQGHAQISKGRENVNFINKSQQICIFLYLERRFCILRFWFCKIVNIQELRVASLVT